MRVRAAAALAVLAANAACSSGSAPAAGPPRLVILYATCTLAKGFLSPYDAAVTWTPHLDAFAGRGVVFERHQTEAGLSGVAFASLFSGVQADRHGVFSHPMRLPREVLLITEAFSDAGFETWFWGDHELASPDLGYARGVPPVRRVVGAQSGHVPDPRLPAGSARGEAFLRANDPRFARLLDGLRRNPSQRVLVVTNFTVTHAPYSIAWLDDLCRHDPAACPDERARVEETAELFWRHYVDLSWNFDAAVRRLGLADADVTRIARVAELLYRANVHRLDRLFGEIVAAVDATGLAGETAIAFTADHGELLHREGAIYPWNHGFALAPEVLSVPWLVVAPGVPPGRFPGVTRSIDVFPTLAGAGRRPAPGRRRRRRRSVAGAAARRGGGSGARRAQSHRVRAQAAAARVAPARRDPHRRAAPRLEPGRDLGLAARRRPRLRMGAPGRPRIRALRLRPVGRSDRAAQPVRPVRCGSARALRRPRPTAPRCASASSRGSARRRSRTRNRSTGCAGSGTWSDARRALHGPRCSRPETASRVVRDPAS